jgi:hypothetical protein
MPRHCDLHGVAVVSGRRGISALESSPYFPHKSSDDTNSGGASSRTYWPPCRHAPCLGAGGALADAFTRLGWSDSRAASVRLGSAWFFVDGCHSSPGEYLRASNLFLRDERNDPMNLTTVQMDQKEEETLTFEVSDEVLESAASTEMATPFTMGSCTSVSVCPSW